MLNNELRILSILTLTTLGILLFLLVYLIIRKANEIKKREKINQYKEEYNAPIFLMLTEGMRTRGLSPKTHYQQIAIEELLIRYSKGLEKAEEKDRLTVLATKYLNNYYRKRLKSWRWSIRMNTLYHIEDFNMVQLLQDVKRLLKKKRLSHDELIHVLRTLALFQLQQMTELMTNQYAHLSEYDYRNILIRFEHAQFVQFVLHFHKSHPALQKAILDVISIKKEVTYHTFLENIFSSYSGEVRLRALKAIAEIGCVKNIDPYLDLLVSPKWEERMVAAKLIGSLRENKGIPRLIELLHDPTWWVRSQAGQAICQFTNGKEILQSVLETSQDAFAKDMAWEWLHKGG